MPLRLAPQRRRRRLSDLHVDYLTGPGLSGEVHYHVLARTTAPATRLPAWTFHEHLCGGADKPQAALMRLSLREVDQALHALALDLEGKLARQYGRGCALACGEHEREGGVESGSPHQVESGRESSSVSPGKPAMRSVVTAMSATAARKACDPPQVPVRRVYPRPMAGSMRSEPDCAGRWTCSQTDGSSRHGVDELVGQIARVRGREAQAARPAKRVEASQEAGEGRAAAALREGRCRKR